MPTFSSNALAGKVAIVTGGGTGIGRAIALEFAKTGADVVLASRKTENLEKVAQEVRALGRKALAVECDVRERAQVDGMVAAALQAFGRIDILVNNAAGNFNAPAEGLSQNGWNAVVRIVLDGTWYCSQAVGKAMIAAKRGGVIINITSNTPLTGSPGNVHSASAKGGVTAMAHTLALEWAKHGIRVMCVAPGQTETEGVRQQLWQNPESDKKYLRDLPPKNETRRKVGKCLDGKGRQRCQGNGLRQRRSSTSSGKRRCAWPGERPWPRCARSLG
jgi:NAD(P)-dependent dehydrogenase (short-subunit alcohol dehydrogenase family)